MSFNLPPGVTGSMLPGSRSEELDWEEFVEDLVEESENLGLSVLECRNIWCKGVKSFLKLKKNKGRKYVR